MISDGRQVKMGTHGRTLMRGAAVAVVAVGIIAAGGAPAGAASHGTPPRRSVAVAPSGPAASVGDLAHIWQTYNNCGPASVAEVLSYWGVYRTQYQAQIVLRADNNPRGMWPYGVPGYARSVGVRALVGVAGTPRLVEALVSNGFPVIVNQAYSVTDSSRHYRPIQSYDDRQGVFVSSDPFGGAGYAITYADFNKIWAVANNRFIVLYPPSKALLTQRDARLGGLGSDAGIPRRPCQDGGAFAFRQGPHDERRGHAGKLSLLFVSELGLG